MCCENSCGKTGVGEFCVGMAMGLVAGMAVGVTLCPTRREMKKMAHNATRHMNDMVDHFVESMNL